MPVLLVFVVGVAVALIRRRLVAPADGRAPARLVAWSDGLLAAPADDRPGRWRFAVGRVAAAAFRLPRGLGAAVVTALTALAVAAGVVYGYAHHHYGLNTDGWSWVGAAILIVVLAGYVVAGSVLVRRPGVLGPGLAGGLLVAATWVTAAGVTFDRWLNAVRAPWPILILAPIAVGAGAVWWSGDAVMGRRVARLATVVAALGVYLYGLVAVAVTGPAGHDPSDGWTVPQIVADQLGNQAVFYLFALPLVTATTGWAAAAATARFSRRREVEPVRSRRTWYLLLLAAVVISALLVLLTLLGPRSR